MSFGALPAARVTYLLRQVCHSLAEAHSRGLVHRDIKPANVYVCRMGLEYDFVKVLDFGLVTFSTPSPGRTLLSTGDPLTTGTPAYMAPEVILGQEDVDARSDVYSIGCLAYWMLTGQLVFEGNTVVKMLMNHLETPPVPPSKRTELPIPPELERIVLACLEKIRTGVLRMARGCGRCCSSARTTNNGRRPLRVAGGSFTSPS